VRYRVLESGRSYVVSGGAGDIVLADGTVSSPHALLVVEGGGAWVIDLNSATGTFVDETRSSANARWRSGGRS
jgi:hypothetical protein